MEQATALRVPASGFPTEHTDAGPWDATFPDGTLRSEWEGHGLLIRKVAF